MANSLHMKVLQAWWAVDRDRQRHPLLEEPDLITCDNEEERAIRR